MSIYSPQRKAIYLSPNWLELLHRRRGIATHIHYTMFPARSQYAQTRMRAAASVETYAYQPANPVRGFCA
jgi:hypothetical protein